MNTLEATAARLAIARELLRFFWHESRWWWLTPIIVIALLFVVVVIFAEVTPLSPLIYRLL